MNKYLGILITALIVTPLICLKTKCLNRSSECSMVLETRKGTLL